MRSSITRLGATLAAVALAAAACGGDGEETGGETESTAESMAESADDSESMADDSESMADDAESMADEGEAASVTTVTEGTLTVCSEIPYPPFEVEDPDSPSGYSGFDIDISAAIAEELGLELSVVNAGFDALTSGAAFAAGTCDMAASAMTITEEREQNIDFSDGYYNAAQSLAVPTGSDISELGGVSGRLGVQSGTTGEVYAEENAPEGVELVSFNSGADLFLALTSGDIVAILQDLPVNLERVNNSGDIEVVETYETDEDYGLAFPEEGSEDLVEAVNGALSTLRENGTYDEVYDEYFSS